MDKDKRVIDLTVGELMQCIIALIPVPAPISVDTSKTYVHGLKGIAALLHCSETTVSDYRRQGWIEPAISQVGRKIVCDAQLALELFCTQGPGRKQNNKRI